jgi:N-acetylmuramoyl-L-alanine amidase
LAIKIFIDQGHNPPGSPNGGATGNGIEEAVVTYNVGSALRDLLSKDPRFEVRVSRPTPTTSLGTNSSSSLRERVRLANEWPADWFISIHVNSNPDPSINGTEVYIHRYNTQPQYMAQQIMNGITEMVGTKNNGIIARPSLFVLRRTSMPALLVELAYLSNTDDAVKLRDNQQQFAQGIYNGILRYFGFA